MRTKVLASLAILLLTAALWGCGSGGSGGDQTKPGTDIEDAQKLGSATCKVCHTTVADDDDQGFNGSAHDNDAVAGCEGCHGGGQFHKGIGPIPYPDPEPARCTTCHTLSAIKHTDNAATTTAIEGMVVKTAEDDACQACHYDIHDPKLTINEEWAESAHGGHIATGPATDATAPAWVHYDWDSASRSSCQRCHTATGISNFLDDYPNYNAANNDFSHLSGWTVANKTSGQNEMLYCWGCHSDVAEGELRNPGAITESYAAINNSGTGTTGTPAVVTYPDVNASNVCMGCHLGREIGQNIKNTTDADGVLGFVNSHYLTAGGTVFNTSGYEYAGSTYSTYGYHKNIGVGDPAANFNTGSSGPCVTCHMSDGEGHTFVFVEENEDGEIDVNSSPICTNCHSEMSAATLEATRENFHAALEELKEALDAKGIYFFNAHPYFYAGPNGTGGAFTNWGGVYGAAAWQDVMGAAFNYNLFEHDPGAYAHNSDYALKLIADSIDFIQDGAIDGDESLASALIGQGMNIEGGTGYSPIHDVPVATAVATPVPADAAGTCSQCHPAAPHFGGEPGERPQWVNNQVASCAECHASNDPSLNQLVLTQYADSGHGDVTGVWTHEEDGGTCSRCHTTSGYIANFTGGSFSYGASDPLQTLNCNACHTSFGDEDGEMTLRAAAAYTATWSQNSVTASVAYPDAGDSNLCIRCHSARRAGANITNSATTTAHYLPAATVVFGGTANLVDITATANGGFGTAEFLTGGGYEFTGQVYAGLGSHKFIELGDEGPCVACHMSGSAGHTWNAVSKNEETGEVTAVNSTACSDCHGGDITPAYLNTQKAAFEAALDTLEGFLNARDIYFNEDGRFYKTPNDTSTANRVDTAYYTAKAAVAPAVSVRDLQGAAYNLWLFKYEGADPAGYVHNPLYARELIDDSADLLNDGTIDGDF